MTAPLVLTSVLVSGRARFILEIALIDAEGKVARLDSEDRMFAEEGNFMSKESKNRDSTNSAPIKTWKSHMV